MVLPAAEGTPPVPPNAAHDGSPASVAAALRSLVGSSAAAVEAEIVLDERLVQSRVLAVPPLAPRHRQAAVELAFEPFMAEPLEERRVVWTLLEEAADGAAPGADLTVAAWAAPRAWLEELLAAFAAARWQAEWIVPEAALWLPRLRELAAERGPTLLAVRRASSTLLLLGEAGRPPAWTTAADEGDLRRAARQMTALLAGRPLACLAWQGDEGCEPGEALRSLAPQAAVERLAPDVAAILDEAAAGTRPLPNFRSGPLASGRSRQRLVRHALAAGGLLLVGLVLWTVANFWQARQLRAASARSAAAQAALWQGLFPGKPVPGDVPVHLSSECRRLQALAGAEGPAAGPSALSRLRLVLSAVPPKARLDLDEIRVDPVEVTLQGETEDHQTAEALAQAIDRLAEFSCAPPRSENLAPHRTTFVLRASPRKAAPGQEGQR